MGIDGMLSLLKKCPEAVQIYEDKSQFFESCQGKRFAVDVAVCMYKYAYYKEVGDDEQFLTHFLDLHQLVSQNGKNQVYFIFEGKGKIPAAKLPELKHRAEVQIETKKRTFAQLEALKTEEAQLSTETCTLPQGEMVLKMLDIFDQKSRVERQFHLQVLPVHYENLRRLFRKHKIVYFEAAQEAEYCASWMAQNGLVDIVITDDWDAVASGSPQVLRHVIGSNAKHGLQMISFDAILKKFQLTRDQFVDVCILAGCDYCCTLPKIGIHHGLKAIQKFKTMENFLASSLHAQDASLMSKFCFQEARKLLSINPETPCQFLLEILR
jgi:flap endonuclease-1